MDEPKIEDPIAELITNYHELNSSVIEELDEEPSALEFMRFVARNTPFVVRGAALDWQATRTWSVDYLKAFLGDEPVNVAVTPEGNADAPTPYTSPQDGTTTLVFAKPHEEDQPFSTFLDYLTTQEHTPPDSESSPSKPKEIRYAQTQNDNLRAEYRPLFSAVPPSIPWARIALARDPDAINLWIGNSRSVTALHKDNYENVYVQVAGRKHFVLLPPVCHAAVGERLLRPAVYTRTLKGSATGEDGEGLKLMLEEDGEAVPFATWDPDRPGENATPYSALVQPTRVTLEPGDMLYLPCMWYHKVSQSCSPEGVCIAVNYWYDMDFTGPLYPLSTFVRSVSNQEK
ncbi:cupin-like domain-containing protein [Parachaetomium inaequale]|uniref:Cupin-like domain-containing protein n=1 Tax=Parachaetomium inaequale TaxID=2588326 RepID=A0AAN6PAS7_9PEZI|nr:cupin-like domain-containing protein [Parachaetomium inaequale]